MLAKRAIARCDFRRFFMNVLDRLANAGVVPVVVIDDAKDAVKAILKMIDCYDEYKNVDDAMYVEIGYEADDEDGENKVLCVKMSGKWYVLG